MHVEAKSRDDCSLNMASLQTGCTAVRPACSLLRGGFDVVTCDPGSSRIRSSQNSRRAAQLDEQAEGQVWTASEAVRRFIALRRAQQGKRRELSAASGRCGFWQTSIDQTKGEQAELVLCILEEHTVLYTSKL